MEPQLTAIRLPPAAMPEALQATWDAGRAVLPLPWQAPEPVITQTLEIAHPDRILEPDGERLSTHAGARTGQLAEDTALVVVTSGSTGRPKAVMLTHRALRHSTSASLDALGAATGQRFTLALPLHHVAGLQIVLRSWACGSEPEILANSEPETIASARGDHLSLVPAQLARLVAARVDLTGWSTILVGGARINPELQQAAIAQGARIVTSYGMTETGGGCVYDHGPLRGVDLRIREDSRILIRGPMLFTGYLNDDAATRAAFQDGWFITGDAGALRNGRLEVLGRADDLIVSAGENVPASLVAEHCRRHPSVADAVVVGIEDATWGEVVTAVVVPRDPADPPKLTDLQEQLLTVLPRSHLPRRLVVVDSLPTDQMGKPTPELLRAIVSADDTAE